VNPVPLRGFLAHGVGGERADGVEFDGGNATKDVFDLNDRDFTSLVFKAFSYAVLWKELHQLASLWGSKDFMGLVPVSNEDNAFSVPLWNSQAEVRIIFV